MPRPIHPVKKPENREIVLRCVKVASILRKYDPDLEGLTKSQIYRHLRNMGERIDRRTIDRYISDMLCSYWIDETTDDDYVKGGHRFALSNGMIEVVDYLKNRLNLLH
ncbi:hypothetical protein [Pseudidiomarina mangrovi]|uniref:hypothetical protein n=1 Tax=Pseudidiomarina mangrovi TaxID=2487133 RepID=UPI000FCCDB2D|nr:hypothetical protein [Pseudidiomarina mangrovi]